MQRSGLAALVALVLALPLNLAAAAAATVQYDCRFVREGVRDGGWVPSVLVLRHDDATGAVTVFDPVIKHFAGEPVSGRVIDVTPARITFGWSVQVGGPTVRGQSARMDYRLSHYRNGRPARMIVTPAGYDNSFSGEGTCRAKPG